VVVVISPGENQMLASKSNLRRFSCLLLCYFCYYVTPQAADVSVLVTDQNGETAEHAVVSLVPISKSNKHTTITKTAVMDQIDRQYNPYILVVQQGTNINFPNWDNIKHQVYSFSAAKRFELKLYSGKKLPPVKFDKPGSVALGCNIHDWMLGYIYIAESDYFALTDSDGMVEIDDVPLGEYTVKVWHPGIRGKSDKYNFMLKVTDNTKIATVSLKLKKINIPTSRPTPDDEY